MEDYDHSESLTVLMKRVLKQHRHNVDLLIQKYEVFPGQPPILLRLAKTDGLIQKDLAAHIHSKPATVTSMLTRMEKNGLVKRQTDPNDHRISRVYLTEKGRHAASCVKEVMRELESRCFQTFSKEEKEQFGRMLLQVQSEMNDFYEEHRSLHLLLDSEEE